MKILLTSDLHYRKDWYAWIEDRAAHYACIVIAGDLIDMMEPDPMHQQQWVQQWVERIENKGISVFLCEGNHDHYPKPWPWLQARLGLHLHQKASFSCLAWGPADPDILSHHRYVSRERGLPWIVLQHAPPLNTLVSAGQTSCEWSHFHSLAWRPDFIACGHIHSAPWILGGNWWDYVADTFVFNPGYQVNNEHPCQIELDLEKAEATWITREATVTLVMSTERLAAAL